ncbi:MAG: hypothetical protein R3Y19_03975 [Rikenellaceae bacterium]
MKNKFISLGAYFTALIFGLTQLTGCNDYDYSDAGETETGIYSAIYTINSISDDVFELGTLRVDFKDATGVSQTAYFDQSQLPGSVSVSNVSENFEVSFNLVFTLNESLKISEESYTLSSTVSCAISTSEGGLRSWEISSESSVVDSETIEEAVVNFFESGYEVTGTAGSLLYGN